DIARAGTQPVDEFDAELDGAAGLAHELGLVDAEHNVEAFDMRQRRLADTDGADLVALDQGDVVIDRRQQACEARRAHPAGSAAAEDHDAIGAVRRHGRSTFPYLRRSAAVA